MLKGPLHFLNRKGRSPYVHFWFLGVFYGEAKSGLLVSKVAPTSLLLAKVGAFLPYGDANALIVENHSIQPEELYQMMAQVSLLRTTSLVLPLQIASHQHCE